MTLFADGEPLDVDKLNSLAQRVQDMEAQFNAFTTRYDANNKRVINTVPIITTGTIDVSVKDVRTETITIPSNAFLTSDPIPSIYITIGNTKSQGVTFSVNSVTRTSFNLKLHSPIQQDIKIYWMAISQRTIS